MIASRPIHHLRRWTPAIGSAAALALVVSVGSIGGNSPGRTSSADDSTTSGAILAATSTASSSTIRDNPGDVDSSLTVPPSTQPLVVAPTDPAVVKTQLSASLKYKSSGPEVVNLQLRLKELGFDPGDPDGSFGRLTQQALWAFEKLILGTPSAEATGILTNEMWQRMQDPIAVQPLREVGEGKTHMEIFLDKQVGIVFTNDIPVLIAHISSGTGETWCEIAKYNTDEFGQPLAVPIEKDICGVSKTPGGVFKFYRRVAGERIGALGSMWNPVYFNYGIAVHGSRNVPLTPASHGCIRLHMDIADYFPSLVANGDKVYVWDGVKEPEEQTKADRTPPFNYPNPAATTSTTSTSTTVPATTTPVATTTTVVSTTTTSTTTTTTSTPTSTSSSAP
ncbi:MAG: murein L,D-transpeptidase [Actinobacteria bacterium]|nr:murein L,D-transpeptidase [Actinomycetota bacterium]